jgi:hypothetical protein
MPTPVNGTNGQHGGQPEVVDPLQEAESLKIALQSSLNTATRLISSLRYYRRQRRAVESAVASLRQLNPHP